jgi:purine-binding chemotaxis protein CheW
MKKQRPCVLFTLCKESFGMDVENVLRVINLEKIMKVPKAPTFIVGALSLDGNVIPVVDLAKKIELGETTITAGTKVMVLEIFHDDTTLLAGVLIDDVLDVVTIEENKLLPPVLESMGFDADSLHGMYKLEETFYNILNPTKIFEKEFASLV